MLNFRPKIIVYVLCIKKFSIFGIVYVSIYTINDVFVYCVPNSNTHTIRRNFRICESTFVIARHELLELQSTR